MPLNLYVYQFIKSFTRSGCSFNPVLPWQHISFLGGYIYWQVVPVLTTLGMAFVLMAAVIATVGRCADVTPRALTILNLVLFMLGGRSEAMTYFILFHFILDWYFCVSQYSEGKRSASCRIQACPFFAPRWYHMTKNKEVFIFCTPFLSYWTR